MVRRRRAKFDRRVCLRRLFPPTTLLILYARAVVKVGAEIDVCVFRNLFLHNDA